MRLICPNCEAQYEVPVEVSEELVVALLLWVLPHL